MNTYNRDNENFCEDCGKYYTNYTSFHSESDRPEHCADCGCFLKNPLTAIGDQYVRDALIKYISGDGGNESVLREWIIFYDFTVEDLFPAPINGDTRLAGGF